MLKDQIAAIDKALSGCEYPSENHSKDRVAVYHGDTVPLILCGYHEQNYLKEAIANKNAKKVD